MDFSTIKDKILNNEYNTVTEFKVKYIYFLIYFESIINFKIAVYVNSVLTHTCLQTFWPSGGI